MKLVNDIREPNLLCLIENDQDVKDTEKWISNFNKDLIDSGFDQYQYKAVRRDNKIYIELRG